MVTTSNLSHAFRASLSARFGSFFVGTLLFLTALTSQAATVLYSHNFNGAATALNGTAVSGGTQTANWSASSAFTANGGVAATNGSALLPFAPTAGNIYELSGTISVANFGWIGLGFANATAAWMTTPSNSDFTAAATTGFSWIINQYTTPTTQQQDRFLGAGTLNPLTKGATATGQPLTFKIVLNTTGTQWTTEFYINGVKNGATGTYTTNPTINSIGFTTNSTAQATGSISNFQLVAVPEPSRTALLLGCGIIAFFRRRR